MNTMITRVTAAKRSKLMATMIVGFGLIVTSTLAVWDGVEGYAGPDSASGTFDNIPSGAWVDAECSSNGGEASVSISGLGVSLGGYVSGPSGVYSDSGQTSSSGSMSYSLYANGGNSYAVVSVYWF